MIIRFNLLIFISLFFINLLFSQGGIVNNGATIVIPSGVYLVIDGAGVGNYLNKTNTTDGSIDIDGTMILKGDLTNNATNNVFINRDGNGTVQFTSTGNQNINGTTKTIFENLTINKTGDEVALAIDAEVEKTLDLDDGVITTGINYLIHSSIVATDLASFSNASFINGNYRRYIASNASTYSFPLGNGTASTDYHRFDFVNNSIAGVNFLNTKVESIADEDDDDENLTTSQSGTPIIDILETAQWSTIPDALPSGGSYGVKLFVENLAMSDADNNQFCAVKRDDASIDYADWSTFESTTTIPNIDVAGRTYADGYAQRLGYTTFSKHAVAKGVHGLPIELLDFSAKQNSEIVNLFWNTTNEINNDFFTIEKSNDGVDFNYLGFVDGAGNSNSIQNYSFNDNRPFEGVTYYRLKQTDFDGRYSYSNIVSVNTKYNNEIQAVWYNKENNELNVEFNTVNSTDFYVCIYDMCGKQVIAKSDNVEGKQNDIINLQFLPTGIYTISVTSEKYKLNKKVVIIQ